MRASSSPWYEAWPIKALALAVGAGLVYLGQIRYEKGLRKEERLEAGILDEDAVRPRFEVLAQVDLAGEPEDKQLRLIGSVVRGLRFIQNDGSLADVRALIDVSIPLSMSGKLLGTLNSNTESSPVWSFEIADPAGLRVKLEPLPSPTPGIVCLRVPYSTQRGIDPAELWVQKDGATVAKLPISPLRPIPIRKLDPESLTAPLEVTQGGPEPTKQESEYALWVPSYSTGIQPARYHVILKTPVPPGQTAYVRLVSTEYAAGLPAEDWTPFRNSEAYVTSPCGVLAKRAELKVVFVTPKPYEETVIAPLGQIVVQYGQPTFRVKDLETIPLSRKAALVLKPQGPVFMRPPHHPNLTIEIYASVPRGPFGGTDDFADIVNRIDWVAPNPASLGLQSIWLPWHRVSAPSRPAIPAQEGPLKATLHVHLTSLQVHRSFIAVVPIESPR